MWARLLVLSSLLVLTASCTTVTAPTRTAEVEPVFTGGESLQTLLPTAGEGAFEELRERLAVFERNRYGQEWTTTDLLLGLVGDLGDLAKLVQAHEGKRDVADLDRALVHELGDCLWALIVIADRLGVDLDDALQTMSSDVHRWLDDQAQ